MSETSSQFQPKDLNTGERLATTGRAVAQGIRYEAKGEHETQRGADLVVDDADAQAIIEQWPNAQKSVAEQMLARYGPANEATPTRLTWYRNGAWKRTEITSDAVVQLAGPAQRLSHADHRLPRAVTSHQCHCAARRLHRGRSHSG